MMRGNLFEEENTQNNRKDLLIKEIGIILIILALIVSGVHYYFNYQQLTELRAEKEDQQEQREIIYSEYEQYEILQNRREKLNELKNIEVNRFQMGSTLGELSRLIPDEVMFTHINFAGEDMYISGRAFYEAKIQDFAEDMDNSAYFSLSDIEMEEQDDILDFEMKLALEAGETLP